jgi:hypothetical protein
LSTSVNIHRYESLVASSEIGTPQNNGRAIVHIWDHVQLVTITELRKEQFGSQISLLSFSNKSDDGLLLIVSRDRPDMIQCIDWKHNEIIYNVTVRVQYRFVVC